jgi:hypothetical protein
MRLDWERRQEETTRNREEFLRWVEEREERKRLAREARDKRLRSMGIEPGPMAWYRVLPDWLQAILLGVAVAVPVGVVLIAIFR